MLRRHLRKPKFGEYHVCACACAPYHAITALTQRRSPVFTNIVKESFLQELADADEGELIKQVQVRPGRRF